jgi:alkaline phosphatase D
LRLHGSCNIRKLNSPNGRKTMKAKGNKRRPILIISLIFPLILSCSRSGLENQGISGPMLGYSSYQAVGVWIQSKEPAGLQIEYWIESNPNKSFRTVTIQTKKEDHFVAQFDLEALIPGTSYGYGLIYNGKHLDHGKEYSFKTKAIWKPSAPEEFSFAIGSCSYIDDSLYQPSPRDETGYGIYDQIADQGPQFMVWLGDNIYLRDGDIDSRYGIFSRYSHDRGQAFIQNLLHSMNHYAIWDDHDFGPNNEDASYGWKSSSLEAFGKFWMNPNQIFPKKSITSSFSWEDLEFFLLDNRSFRSANGRKSGQRAIWGKVQMEWLINALKSSPATFKIICTGGQFLSTARVFENHINLAEKERRSFLDSLNKEEIGGVIFLTGDRHHSELSKLKLENGKRIYDWTVSPLTGSIHDPGREGNNLIIEGSYISEQLFGLIRVSGESTNRILVLEAINSTGSKIWTYTISQEELY